jgi:multidrug efflux pump subunit AcrA (membrane-fusion protein)
MSLTLTPAPPAKPPAAEPAGDAALPQAQRLHAQLAALVEAEPQGADAAAETRPLLEFLRALLGARAVALLPVASQPALAACIVATRGVQASQLVTLAAGLDFREAAVQPAPELGDDAYTLAAPVSREGAPLGWLLAQVVVPNPRDLRAYLVLLQALAGFLLYREQRRATRQAHWALERTAGFLEILRRAGAELDFDQACRVAVDALRDYLGCARVSLGLKCGPSLRLRTISGMARIDGRSAAHQPAEAAIREAILLARRVDFCRGEKPHEAIAHDLLQQKSGAARLTTVPLARGRGGVVLEWSAPPDEQTATLLDAATPVLAVLFDLLDRARPPRALFLASRWWSRLTRHRRTALLAGAAAFAALLACPFHYTIRVDCRLAPTVKRVVAAPFDGQLRTSFVRPGDRVSAGQPLAELDNRELTLKEAELTAARERALKQRDKAMSNQGEGADFAAAQLANFEAQSVSQELELTRRRLAMLALTAPLEGVIVSGDLRRAEGQPVEQGQVLFEVAPLDAMIVELDVPDREISRVRTGMPLRFRLEAFAGERWHGAVERLHPRSEQREGRNVFICEAPIANTDARFDLRPGMRGRAAIESDRRPLLWIAGHRLWDFVVETLLW